MQGGIVSGGQEGHYAFVENGAEICRLLHGDREVGVAEIWPA